MATTQNLYTGDGSTKNYSFTFEYLKQADVKVTLNTVATTAFTFANATTLSFTSAPANNVAIRIFRDTAIDTLSSTFFPGSAIKAEDLNQNFTQSLYVTQESETAVGISDTTANSAVTTANSAVTTANSAVTTANSANTKSDAAVTTANTASTNASSAVTTANTAVTTANTANTNASAAVVTANAASATVANAVLFTLIANVAAIPGSPSNDDYIEIGNSTGIESFSPLSGLPSGFAGASGLTVRLRYDNSASSWVFLSYFANDSEDRYFKKTSGNTNTTAIATNVTNIATNVTNIATNVTNVATNTTNIATNVTNIATNVADIATNVTNIATKMPLAGGTFTGDVSFNDNVIAKGDSTNGSGQITLNCENNSHGVKIKGPPHSAGANYTLTLPNDTGTNGRALITNGSGVSSWSTVEYTPRTSATGSSNLSVGTTAQRDGSPAAGMIRYNSTLSQFEGYGSAWGAIGGAGGATGGGSDEWAIEMDNTITTSYTITTGKNVVSAGPLTINSGAIVTVPSGSNWVIV